MTTLALLICSKWQLLLCWSALSDNSCSVDLISQSMHYGWKQSLTAVLCACTTTLPSRLWALLATLLPPYLCSHATRQGMLSYSHLSSLSHCRPILGLKEWNWCMQDDPHFKQTNKIQTTGGEQFVEPPPIILACEEKSHHHYTQSCTTSCLNTNFLCLLKRSKLLKMNVSGELTLSLSLRHFSEGTSTSS